LLTSNLSFDLGSSFFHLVFAQLSLSFQKAACAVASSVTRCYDFLKYFGRKIQQKKLAFLTQNKAM
jgi:hypothetical protein